MFDQLTRDGDPPFRFEPSGECLRVCIEKDSASVLEFLRQADPDLELPVILNSNFVADSRCQRVIGLRLNVSSWIQFDLDPDFTDSLVMSLMEDASEALNACVYVTGCDISGFSYSLQKSGEIVEDYSRYSEPVFEYIPEEERKAGTLVTTDNEEFIWSQRAVKFDQENGLEKGHEQRLLKDLGLDVVVFNWPLLEDGKVVAPTNCGLTRFSEILVR